LSERYGTPLLIGFRSRVERQLEAFRRSLPQVHWLYAVKANSSPELLRLLAGHGIGFDIASAEEGEAVREAWDRVGLSMIETDEGIAESRGTSMPRLVHGHPCKKPEDIRRCYQAGVRRFAFDSFCEVEKLSREAPAARLWLRMAVANRSGRVDLSRRFGADPEECLPLLAEAQRHRLEVDGLSFHVGSQAVDPQDFEVALRQARRVWLELVAAGGELRYLDIGGGFPVSYRDQPAPGLLDYGRSLQGWLDQSFGDIAPCLVAEPGRAMVAPAVVLVATVIGKRRRGGRLGYTIDDGRYGSFSGRYFTPQSFFFESLEPRGRDEVSCQIAGPTCDGGDLLATDYCLPEMEVGERMLVQPMGAYTAVGACRFHGFPMAKQVWIN
jgi:ornithine decarboxylase